MIQPIYLTKEVNDLDSTKPFQFIEVKDYGFACCPHCGAEGRYIYTWAEFGKLHSAMAGCYKMLTGKLNKGEKEKYFEKLAEKIAKQKPLSGFDKSILRLVEFRESKKYPEDWCNQKIEETLSKRKQYLAKKRF